MERFIWRFLNRVSTGTQDFIDEWHCCFTVQLFCLFLSAAVFRVGGGVEGEKGGQFARFPSRRFLAHFLPLSWRTPKRTWRADAQPLAFQSLPEIVVNLLATASWPPHNSAVPESFPF